MFNNFIGGGQVFLHKTRMFSQVFKKTIYISIMILLSEKAPLVSYEEFACLNVGQCYVILPEISARLAKIQVPKAMVADKNRWFIEGATWSKIVGEIYQQPNNLDLDSIETNTEVTTRLKNEAFIFNR